MLNEISTHLSKAYRMAKTDKEGALSYLEAALKDSSLKVSIFGSTYITSSSQNGYASFDKVLATANTVFDEYRKTWNFSNKDRERIKTLEVKIDKLLNKSDETLKSCNIFTKIFNWIKTCSFIPYPYTNRFYWEENTRLSTHYTKEQWRKNFWFWDRPRDFVLVSHQPDVYYHN